MKYIIALLIIGFASCNLRTSQPQSNDFIKCLATTNKIIETTTVIVDEFKKTPKDVEKIINLAGDLLKEIPDFLNNCIGEGTFPWDVKTCVADLQAVAVNGDKLAIAIKNKDIGEIVSNVMAIVLAIPNVSLDCFHYTFPIDVGQCMGDFFNFAYHVQAAMELIKVKPIDPEQIIPQIAQSLEGIQPMIKDCLKISFPYDSVPCIDSISTIALEIVELVKKIEVRPINIQDIIVAAKKIVDTLPSAAQQCYPPIAPHEACIKDIELIIDDVASITLEFLQPVVD